MTTIILLAFLILFPVLINWLENRTRIVRWLSPMIICYLTGIILGNTPGLPLNKELLNATTGVSVLLAIPLLLFSANFHSLMKQVRPALFAFFLGVMGVNLMAVISFFIFRQQVPEAASVSGMMIGVYTGGTANMNAIGMALGVQEEVFILLNSADIVFSGLYFIFLLTIGKRVLSLFLPSIKREWVKETTQEINQLDSTKLQTIKQVTFGFLLSFFTLIIAIGFSRLVMNNWSLDRAIPLIIMGITTLGIAASFQKKVRQLPHTYSSANYLLLVFALAMGSMANFTELLASTSGLFLFCGFTLFGSIILQFLLAFIFRIDRDTAIIASTASIFGPAFIGPVANALGNKDIIAMGIALGLIGFAIGNYLGLSIAFLLS